MEEETKDGRKIPVKEHDCRGKRRRETRIGKAVLRQCESETTGCRFQKLIEN